MEIHSKVFRLGNSYAVLIPKKLVSCKVLEEGRRYKVLLVPEDEIVELPRNAPVISIVPRIMLNLYKKKGRERFLDRKSFDESEILTT
jgi:antitoxin component of MazEF toxin-antitoxin module